MADIQLSELIDGLSASLKPVRRLPPPLVRALAWFVAVAVVAAALYVALGGNFAAVTSRAYILPSFIGAVLAAVLAGIAAFQLSVPDRADSWVLLPTPAVLLWVGFAGVGCLANLGDASAWGSSWPETRECLLVILGSSIPLSLVSVYLLRRARPERGIRVALMAGLASAAAAGGILMLVHPHNSTALDLVVHGLCVSVVIGLNAVLGGGALRRTHKSERP